MKYDYLNVIGLMTGTSMDGIDISLVKTNGEKLIRLNKNYYYRYSVKTRKFLLKILNKSLAFNLKRKKILDEVVTNEHYLALKNLDIVKDAQLIGFHGQTIYHNANEKQSIQLGNPNELANMIGKNIVFDFRKKDIQMGGHGAPLAPIYHKLIIESSNLELPSCILNIGGVSNLTYWDGNKLIGFDAGPGNALMDNYMQQISISFFDKKGNVASKGKPNKEIVKTFLLDSFFNKYPPKSLDRNYFQPFYDDLVKLNFSKYDIMATLMDFTVESITKSFSFLPKKIKSILVTGGGYRNDYLMKSLKKKIDANFFDENELNLKFDYIESELIAYLSVRSIYKLPYTFPSTTGVLKPCTGGKLYSFYKNPF